jgi:hypothetical protein
MEYKGVEYSVVQLTDGIGWRWEIRLDDGKNKSSSTPVSRAVAIKQAEQEIDRILKSGKWSEAVFFAPNWFLSPGPNRHRKNFMTGIAAHDGHDAFQTSDGWEGGMAEYRAYSIGIDGHIVGFEALVCADDVEAINKAKRLVDGHDIELWSGVRLVIRLNRKTD